MIDFSRRGLLLGMGVALIVAPAIVPIRSLMAMPRRRVFVPKPGQLYLEFSVDPFGHHHNVACEDVVLLGMYRRPALRAPSWGFDPPPDLPVLRVPAWADDINVSWNGHDVPHARVIGDFKNVTESGVYNRYAICRDGHELFYGREMIHVNEANDANMRFEASIDFLEKES